MNDFLPSVVSDKIYTRAGWYDYIISILRRDTSLAKIDAKTSHNLRRHKLLNILADFRFKKNIY